MSKQLLTYEILNLKFHVAYPEPLFIVSPTTDLCLLTRPGKYFCFWTAMTNIICGSKNTPIIFVSDRSRNLVVKQKQFDIFVDTFNKLPH